MAHSKSYINASYYYFEQNIFGAMYVGPRSFHSHALSLGWWPAESFVFCLPFSGLISSYLSSQDSEWFSVQVTFFEHLLCARPHAKYYEQWNSFNKYLLHESCVPGTVQDYEDKVVNKTVFWSYEVYILVGRTDNKIKRQNIYNILGGIVSAVEENEVGMWVKGVLRSGGYSVSPGPC